MTKMVKIIEFTLELCTTVEMYHIVRMNWELCCFLIMICFVQWKGNTGESTQKHRTVKWIHFTVLQQSFIMWFHICAAHIQFHQMQIRNVNFIRWKHKFSQISIYFILFSCFFFVFLFWLKNAILLLQHSFIF